MKTIFSSLFLSFVFSANLFGSTVLISADTLTEKWGVFELTISDSHVYNNPFWDATITARFNGPNNVSYTLKGFYYDSSYWKVRFSPTVIGIWNYNVSFNGADGTKVFSGTFRCSSPTKDNHGFIVVNQKSPHQLKFSDGTLFKPIGTAGHTPAIEAAFLGISPGPQQVPAMWDTLTKYSINTFRLMLFNQSAFEVPFPWNTSETTGNFFAQSGGLDRYNTFVGKVMDRWFRQARDHNIAIYLCMFAGFDISAYPFSSSVWSSINGGPYSTLDEMYQLTSGTGFELEKKYFTYLVNRYSAYRNVVVWEYNNEYGYSTSLAWIAAMDSVVRANDPYNRARTVSFWDAKWSLKSPVDAQRGITLTDDHFYSSTCGYYTEFNVDSAANAQAVNRFVSYEKPVMFGEFGSGENNISDSWLIFQQVAYWGAFMGGGYPLFWLSGGNYPAGWTYNRVTLRFIHNARKISDRMKYYGKIYPDNRLVSVSQPSDVRAYCLSDSTEYLIYLHHYSNHTSSISGLLLGLTFPPIVSSDYAVVWLNASTGDSISSAQGNFTEGTLSLESPDFTIDLLGIIRLKNVVTGIPSTETPNASWRVYPNPANDKLTVQGVNGKFELFVYSSDGKLVLQDVCSNKNINISHLLKGIYIVKVVANNRIVFEKKIIKK